jgi:Flp pilus assembly protein TadD
VVLGLLLVIATLLAYAPAWHGKPIWDDEPHIARPELHSLAGLLRTWIEPGATQQYYPLVYSVFWLEHRLWGDSTLGYHLLNILLHASSALLLIFILRRLAVPGAQLAAAIFALHPVQVESVAWMTELKNTLSGLLFLSSLWAYLHFDQSRNRRWWTLAAGLFVLGLTAKTAIATLPAALLVLLWWQRGSLSWKSDVRPLLSFFAVGLLAGLFTAHIERKLFGAEGWEFNLSFIERILMAGHSLWFHLGKLFWPTHLTFMYPRWDINQSVWWQYLYPATFLSLLAGCWALRRWHRGPLAALLWFAGLLFPALGFFNAYSFRYSFVNDHHQYLACIGMIVLASAALAGLLGRWGLWGRAPGHLLCLALLGTLAGLTWQQSKTYTDMETLWRKTLAQNPTCWMAQNNLGILLLATGRATEAMTRFEQALSLKPDYAEAHNNMGLALLEKGQVEEAIVQVQAALKLQPAYASAHTLLGVALGRKGQLDEAMSHLQTALRLDPNLAKAHSNLGTALERQGRLDEAVAHQQQAVRLKPNDATALANLGIMLAKQGRLHEAATYLEQALALKPEDPDAHRTLGTTLGRLGRLPEAVQHLEKAISLSPGDAEAHCNLGVTLGRQGRFDEAAFQLQQALKLNPRSAEAHCNLGVILGMKGNLTEAISHLNEALKLKPDYPDARNNLRTALEQEALSTNQPAASPPRQ